MDPRGLSGVLTLWRPFGLAVANVVYLRQLNKDKAARMEMIASNADNDGVLDEDKDGKVKVVVHDTLEEKRVDEIDDRDAGFVYCL